MNRDICTLRNCRGMLDEIRLLREEDENELRATIGSPKLTDMPRGGNGGGGLDDVISRAQAIHEKRLRAIAEYEKQIALCEEILQKIDDTTHRALMRALYVEQMPIWRAANMVHMSEATAKRVKAAYEQMTAFGQNEPI